MKFLICLSLLAFNFIFQESAAVSSNNFQTIERCLEVRCRLHGVLFGGFNKSNSDRFVWSEDDASFLMELNVSDGKTVVGKEVDVALIPETKDFVRLFDLVVVRGTGVDEIEKA